MAMVSKYNSVFDVALKSVEDYATDNGKAMASRIHDTLFYEIFLSVWETLKNGCTSRADYIEVTESFELADKMALSAGTGSDSIKNTTDDAIAVEMRNRIWYVRVLHAVWDDRHDRILKNICSISPMAQDETGVPAYEGCEEAVAAIDSVIPEMEDKVKSIINKAL